MSRVEYSYVVDISDLGNNDKILITPNTKARKITFQSSDRNYKCNFVKDHVLHFKGLKYISFCFYVIMICLRLGFAMQI